MANSKNLRTPVIKPRTQGGTFYTFASALEDIGLNINDSSNKVSLSHYALLDIPAFDTDAFDTLSTSTFSGVNVGDYMFAEGFQDYVLNLETLLRNQESYNFATTKTVSERVFWKWLAKSCMNFTQDTVNSSYYVDSNATVKAFGAISSSAQRSDTSGVYNETFVQIPSSFGQMKVLFKKYEDSNCRISSTALQGSRALIENVTSDEYDANTFKLHTGISANAIYDNQNSKTYTIGDNDCMCMELSLDALRSYYGDTSITFDDLAIDDTYTVAQTFPFNAILLYYSIYDSTGTTILATNAYGVLILNSAETSNGGTSYKFPELVKVKSSTSATGTSYSFRVNIKATSVYSSNLTVNDNSTASYSMATDYNDVVHNLATAIDVLKSNANLIAVLKSDSTALKDLAAQALSKVGDLEQTVTALKGGTMETLQATTVQSTNASFENIDASTAFINTDPGVNNGETVGSLDGDTFTYKNIVATSLKTAALEAVSANISSLKSSGTSLVLKNSSNSTIAQFNQNGIYSKNSLFIPNESASAYDMPTNLNDVVNTVFDSIQVTYDHNSTDKYHISLDKNASFTDTTATVINNSMIDGDYINLAKLLAVMIVKIKGIEGTVWHQLGQE